MRIKEHIRKDEKVTLCNRAIVRVGGWTQYAPNKELEDKRGYYCKSCLKRWKQVLKLNSQQDVKKVANDTNSLCDSSSLGAKPADPIINREIFVICDICGNKVHYDKEYDCGDYIDVLLSPHYGSIFDTEEFNLKICEDCFLSIFFKSIYNELKKDGWKMSNLEKMYKDLLLSRKIQVGQNDL